MGYEEEKRKDMRKKMKEAKGQSWLRKYGKKKNVGEKLEEIEEKIKERWNAKK